MRTPTEIINCDICECIVEGEKMSPFSVYEFALDEIKYHSSCASGSSKIAKDFCKKCEDKIKDVFEEMRK